MGYLRLLPLCFLFLSIQSSFAENSDNFFGDDFVSVGPKVLIDQETKTSEEAKKGEPENKTAKEAVPEKDSISEDDKIEEYTEDSWVTGEGEESKKGTKELEIIERARETQNGLEMIKQSSNTGTGGKAPNFNHIRNALEAARDQRLPPKEKPKPPKKTKETLEKF